MKTINDRKNRYDKESKRKLKNFQLLVENLFAVVGFFFVLKNVLCVAMFCRIWLKYFHEMLFTYFAK